MAATGTNNFLHRALGGKLGPEPKIFMTAFTAVLIPVYWLTPDYGPVNFLWTCDVALIITTIALWFENRFLLSMQLVAIAAIQTVWTADYLGELLLNMPPRGTGMAGYMFRNSPVVHGLGLFHLWLPWFLLYTVWRLGYDRRAFVAQVLFGYVQGWICLLWTDTARNLNFVHGFTPGNTGPFSPLTYMLVGMVFYPVVVLLPFHLLLLRFFEKPADRKRAEAAIANTGLGARIGRLLWAPKPATLTTTETGYQLAKR